MTSPPNPYPRKKIRHYDEPGDAHFLTFSCYQRMPLLSKDRSRNWLIEAIEAARQKHAFDLWAWVIMPEHVHMLIWPRRPQYAVRSILADLKRPVGQQAVVWLTSQSPAFLERLTVRNRDGVHHHFWQPGPGQDRNIFDSDTAHQVVEYIHENPVRRGLVGNAQQWQWSSASDWAGHPVGSLRVDRTIPASSTWPK